MKYLKILMMVLLSSLVFAVPGFSDENPPASTTDFDFGLEFGNVTIDGVNYQFFKLKPELNLGKFGVGLDVNFEFNSDWQLRMEEWNTWQAVLAKIKYIRFGKKSEAPVFVKIGGINDFTLGHGQIMYKYDNTLNYPAVRKLGLAFDLDLKFAGFETMVDNIFDWDIIGGRVYARPLINTSIPIIKSLEIGATYVADLDIYNSINSNTNASAYSFSDNPDSYKVSAWGVDLGAIILKNFAIDMLAYADFMVIEGKGSGFGTGEVLGVKGTLIKVIPYRLEVKFLQPKFRTTYFDLLYDGNRAGLYSTLDTYTNAYSGLLFASGLSILKDKLSFLITIEDSFNDEILPTLQFDLVLSKDLLKKIGFRFSWYKANIFYFNDIFKYDAGDSVLQTELQYMISDDLALTVNWKKSYELDANGVQQEFETTTISTSFQF